MSVSVLATDKVNVPALAPLHEAAGIDVVVVEDSSTPEFAEALRAASGLIVRSATRVTADMLATAPALKVIGRAGVGVDNIDIAAATERGVAVFNAPGGNTVAAAELTVGLMLALTRHIPAADASMRRGEWNRAMYKGSELKGKTLGLVGSGRIGTEVAKRCRAFEMDVIVHDPYLTDMQVSQFGGRLVDLDDVLTTSDFISLHVPVNEETRRMIDGEALAKMKLSAVLINASRGPVLDQDALAHALEAGVIAGAALDVYDSEPLADDSPLRDAPNVVLTPHLGASTVEAQVGVATEVAERIRDLLTDGTTDGAINSSDL